MSLEHVMQLSLTRRVLGVPIVERVLRPSRGGGWSQKFIRYSMVSAVAIVISQVTILICAWLFDLSGVAANAIGAVVSTPASYELNRKWAWGKSGKSHMWKEVAPFWALTILGLAASTGTVQIADTMAHSDHVTGLGRAVAIMGASLFAYGVIWIVKFVIFNRLVFVTRPTADDAGLVAGGGAIATRVLPAVGPGAVGPGAVGAGAVGAGAVGAGAGLGVVPASAFDGPGRGH